MGDSLFSHVFIILRRPPSSTRTDTLFPYTTLFRSGMGLDSTAMIIEWVTRGRPLDLVLTADTGSERPETYDYLPIFQRWMDVRGIAHEIVRYAPKRFKHWPPYFSLLENCLTNAPLPSISFGRHSCSQKWKIGRAHV